MKLSEAIRLGAMLRPQAFGAYFHDQKSCALGAAAEASGCAYEETTCCGMSNALQWHVLLGEAVCPQCEFENHFGRVVTHLNDEHLWTREAIADWVATIEPQDIPIELTARCLEAVAEE